jgi:dipeptidyl aminopeptidase/acylaminoacyl peptidase
MLCVAKAGGQMTGKIFLSYRREDAAGFALALFGRLEQSFPSERLFMDVEGGIGAGQDFVRVIEDEVSLCDVMLVLIGPDWLTVTDEAGRRRLENPEDFVRIEVESALKFGKRVIPVLVHKTEMPRADALPEPLKALARRNAVGLTQERFKADAQGLIKALEDALAEVEDARRQTESKAAAAEKQRAAEHAAKAEEAARSEKERARLDAIAGLSPEQIAKAEELANWDFIKASEGSQEFRDHLARFPQGVTERMARKRLEALVWAGLSQPAGADALKGFLAEFPNGTHANEATANLAELESHAAAAREAAEGEKREMDAWASASAAGTVAALEDFRQDWPNGKYANAAHTRIREIKGGPSRRRLLGVGAGAAALGGLAVFGFRPGNLFWRLLYDQSIRTFAGHADAVRSVAFSPDGRNAQSGSNDHTVRLWDVATGEGIRTFAGDGIVTSVAFSPDGRSALSDDGNYTFKLWDVATGKEIRTFGGHTSYVAAVAFSPDGRTALSGSLDKTLKLWDAATGKEIRAFAGHAKYVVSVAFSPDGRNALSGSDDTTLKLWDVATGKEIRTFTGHTGGVSSVAFSPDGRTALSGSFDTTLRLWDLATGKEIRTFAGHTNWVFSVAFSPDGRSELSGSEDHTLKLWDVATGNNIRTFTGHTGGVSSVAFSPDGRSALSGSWDQTLKLWDLTGR